MSQMPGADPFHAEGGPTGVILSHGFTGSPQSMRPWAEHLAAAGYTVSAPLLPGHGTHWRDMEKTRWTDWYRGLEEAYLDLRGRCREVFAFGLSMGGALALRLAETHPRDITGLVLVNPSVGSLRRDMKLLNRLPALALVMRTRAGIGSDIKKPGAPESSYDRTPVRSAYQLTELWKAVRADLGRVAAPTLVYRSRVDHVVDELSVALIRQGVRGATVEERILENSYHVATLDHDAPEIFAGSVEWMRAHSRLREDRPMRSDAAAGGED